jgi:hypothetical protein
MGIYPVGTIVELDTGDRAVVVRQNDQTRFLHRPTVSLFRESGPADETIDLTEPASAGPGFRRTILKSVHDEIFEARKASCFMLK